MGLTKPWTVQSIEQNRASGHRLWCSENQGPVVPNRSSSKSIPGRAGTANRDSPNHLANATDDRYNNGEKIKCGVRFVQQRNASKEQAGYGRREFAVTLIVNVALPTACGVGGAPKLIVCPARTLKVCITDGAAA